jgi:hypothetical protein
MTFFEGSRHIEQWEDYVDEINALGLSKIREVYQEAYDEYMKA